MKIEYRVRPVTRYIVTRFYQEERGAGVEGRGEFDSHDTAFAVAYALCAEEHRRLEWPLGDERIVYPQRCESYTTSVQVTAPTVNASSVVA